MIYFFILCAGFAIGYIVCGLLMNAKKESQPVENLNRRKSDLSQPPNGW